MKKIAFRVDASLTIGSGHVMRCLTLADDLINRDSKCIFVCRPLEGNLINFIKQRGHLVLALPILQNVSRLNYNSVAYEDWLGTDWETDANDTKKLLTENFCSPIDWLVVDHYALDFRWENHMCTTTSHIMVIDDLANRIHHCDVLLDQNLGRTAKEYRDLINPDIKLLIGPQFALLRSEFVELRPICLARREKKTKINHILISMGGVDKDNVTGQLLDALRSCKLSPELQISIVLGIQAPWLSTVKRKALDLPWKTKVLIGVSNMAQIMMDADLAIGAAGGTALERCALGLPSLVLILAENQRASAEALQNHNAVAVFDSVSDICNWLNSIIDMGVDSPTLKHLGIAAAQITDGYGVKRVVQEMELFHA